MNYKELIKKVEDQTGKDPKTCEDIINAYEKCCESEIKRPFKEEVDTHMMDWICESTNHDQQTVNDVLVVLVSLVRSGIKSKIPFM